MGLEIEKIGRKPDKSSQVGHCLLGRGNRLQAGFEDGSAGENGQGVKVGYRQVVLG